MVAPNIRYLIVEVPVMTLKQPALARVSRDLLPWADPYIARLIQRLQAEVKAELAERRITAEAPPLKEGRLDFDVPDYDHWPRRDDLPDGRS